MKKSRPQIQGANILLTHGDTLLLQLRDDIPTISYPNHWALPGGKREGQETAQANATRELSEECGYQMKNPRLVLRRTVTKDNGVTIDEFVFTEEYDGVQPIKCLEGQDIRFVPLSSLHRLTIVPWQKQFIVDVLKTAN